MAVDWLPSRRDEILGMAMKWNNVLGTAADQAAYYTHTVMCNVHKSIDK